MCAVVTRVQVVDWIPRIDNGKRETRCGRPRLSSWTSLSARRNHLNSIDRDDADVAGPRGVRSGKRMHERRESLGGRGMNSEQNDPGSFQGAPTLNGDLPEVLVERQDDARFGLRPIQQRDVACSGKIHAGPQNVVAIGPKRIYDRRSHRRGGASTLEAGTPCIRGRDSRRTTDTRGCPLASGQGSW